MINNNENESIFVQEIKYLYRTEYHTIISVICVKKQGFFLACESK